jgi:hypothetical protein
LNIFIDFGSNTIDACLGERDVGAVGGQVSRFPRRPFEAAASNL